MKVYSYAYSSNYYPTAPVAQIEVRGDKPTGSEVRLTALIDTGADATMLPINVLTASGAQYVETIHIRGVTGIRLPADLFQVTVRIGPHTIPAVRAVALERGADAVLGRDVLNQLVLTLDGPADMVELAV